MKCYLEDYRWCIHYFGKSCADSILRQVKKLSYTKDNCPKVGDSIDMGGFYVDVMEVDLENEKIHVIVDRVKR